MGLGLGLPLALGSVGCSARPPERGAAASGTIGTAADPAAEPAGAGPGGAAGPAAFRIGTFNAGLAVGVIPHASERAPLVVDALARAPVDLLCVQEFWLDAHWDALRSAASARLPHAHRLPGAAPARAGACSREELAPLVACAAQHCAGLRSDALANCVVRRCAQTAARMSLECVNCLVHNPVGTFDEIVARCASPGGAPAAGGGRAPAGGAAALGGGGMVAYGGSFGTGVLSREPLLERDALVFDATLNPRAALYARVSPPGLGDLHVFCTHLTPALAAPPGARSPAAEQREQIERLLAWVDRKAGRGPAIVVGDLNTGPRVGPAIHAVLPGHYEMFVAAGFRNPYAERPDALCSFCSSNPLNGGAGAAGSLIDHVLVRGFGGAARGAPWLRDPVAVDAGGRPLRTALSDHYGLVVTLTP